jgi:hypothetical protein
MKKLVVLLGLLYSTVAFNQTIKLSDENSVKSLLDDKQFTVGNYGSIKFKYVSSEKDFGTIKFNVEYSIPGEKKPKRITLSTDIMIKLEEFYSTSFVRGFSLKSMNTFSQINLNLPTNFELYENGELYYQDKNTMTMKEYMEARKNGEFSIKAAPYKLCD